MEKNELTENTFIYYKGGMVESRKSNIIFNFDLL